MDRGELTQHPRASGVVEGSRDVLIPVSQQAPEGAVALVMTLRTVLGEFGDLLENAPTNAIERYLSQFAKGLPVGFADAVSHESSPSIGAGAQRPPPRGRMMPQAVVSPQRKVVSSSGPSGR